MAIIYSITNKLNNKRYVGSTASAQGLKRRLYVHFLLLNKNQHHNRHLQFSYNKHGRDAFETLILEDCAPEKVLEREQHYIDSLRPEYNIAKNTTAPMTGRKHSPASIEKMRNSQRQFNRWNKGIPQAFEAKLKNVKNNKGYWVICVETGQRFLGLAEAANVLGIYRANIAAVIKGTLKTAGGFRFIKEEIILEKAG